MSTTKALLKASVDAVKQQEWDTAIRSARDLLRKDPKHFQAHILLGFSLDKTNRLPEAEDVYLAASRLKPGDPQPWQGLIQLYRRQGSLRLKQYQHAALQLAGIFRDADEMFKCQDVVDKFVDHARSQGDRLEYAEALSIMVPGSPIYPALEGRLPHPAATYQTQAQIVEADEKRRIDTLIGERRTRIGVRLADVTLDVKRQVYAQSRLGRLYTDLINWATDDDVRRRYEEKQLQYCYDRLLAWPLGEQKERELATVQKLAKDMVIIKHPFKLAWDITVDWNDYREIREWDATVLWQYCRFFPDSDLARVIMGFLTSSLSPFPKEAPSRESDDAPATDPPATDSDDDDSGGAKITYVPETEDDRFFLMAQGIATADSLLAHRLTGEYYQSLEEHASNVDLMRRALGLVEKERAKTGIEFRNTDDVFSVFLGTALVFYQSPRHHQEAKGLFDNVLTHDPSSTAAMIGVGLIYEEEEDYDAAIDFLERAKQRDPENLRLRSEAAWVKALKQDFGAAKDDLEACILPLAEKGPSFKELLGQTQYRLGYCAWHLDTSRPARKSRTGAYAHFLDALKSNLDYAPAYTSLGIYYADYANDKVRAQRCFQKAVELSPSEVVSAERLARSFADDGDWDRVELIAQRVVDSGKVKPPPGSKRKGISWPFAALGVAQLNKQDYHKAIVSFQAALRISPDDRNSWVGLGESYHSSGRYVAATKAIRNAQRLEEPGDHVATEAWFTKFLLADVQRELGDYDDAISLYRDVIGERPDEAGVAIALMLALVDSALDSLRKGFFGKAASLATETIEYATKAPPDIRLTFKFWRAVGDACSIFSSVQARLSEFPADLIQGLLEDGESAPRYHVFQDIDGVGTGIIGAGRHFAYDETVGVELTRCMQATILAHKVAIYVSAHDKHAQSVAYYNLGWAEYRAHTCLPPNLNGGPTRYLKVAMACFKRAIELEAGNAEFWNALGVVTSAVSPAVSQHAFVRSLFLNERSAQAWTNLGILALLQDDFRLANEAFTRAQSTDPDYALAWLGQGLIAMLVGEANEAHGLFTHAAEIGEASSVVAQKHYAVASFDHIIDSSHSPTSPSSSGLLPISSLLQPIFALGRLGAMRPRDYALVHLSALFRERVHDTARAASSLERICAAAEADYEVTGSAGSLRDFTLAKTDLARAYLAVGEYEKAIEAGELAVNLSSAQGHEEVEKKQQGVSDGQEGGSHENAATTPRERGLTDEERHKARLSANVAVGLAHYHLGAADEAVACLDLAMAEAAAEAANRHAGGSIRESDDASADVACVLAQVLWATGREDARERARDVLFGVIGREGGRPPHVQAVVLLGVVALLDGDEESLEAVVAELRTLRARDASDYSRGIGSGAAVSEEQAKVAEVLRAIAATGGAEPGISAEVAVRGEAQRGVLCHPYLPHSWSELADVAECGDDEGGEGDEQGREAVAEMALKLARKGVPPRGCVDTEQLARAYAGTGRAADAQVAVMVAPWASVGWTALADAVAS